MGFISWIVLGPWRRTAFLATLIQFGVVVSVPRAAHAHPSAEARLHAIDRRLGDAPSASIYVEHGKANLQGGHWEEALADADRALALDPRLNTALLLRADVRYARGEIDQALVAVDALLAVQPENAAGHHLRARVLRELGRLDEAASEYDRFLATVRQPLPDHYIERADTLAAQGRLDAALSGLDDGLARLGMVASLELAAVDLEVRRGDFAAAVGRFDSLLERAPRQVFWMVRRAELLATAGRSEDAREAFEAARAALPAATRIEALRALQRRVDDGLRSTSPQARVKGVEIAAQPAKQLVEAQEEGK